MNSEGLEEKVLAVLRDIESTQRETPFRVSADAIAGALVPYTDRMDVIFTLGILCGQRRVRCYDYTENYMTFRSLPDIEGKSNYVHDK